MYPSRYLTYIEVGGISDVLCGQSRLGHFRGVATVVAKLLNMVSPDTLYLGQKDAQQCVVIQTMIRDLNFPINLKIVPTVREKNGLAMSSRNQYLSVEQKAEAAVLYRALSLAKKRILDGEKRSQAIIVFIKNYIQKNSSASVEYVACVDARSLEPLKFLAGEVLIPLAVRLGSVRLIDNILLPSEFAN